MIRIIFSLLFISPIAFAKELSDKEILDLFKPTLVCTDYGVSFGFSFSNLDGYVGQNGKILKITEIQKDKDKPYPKKQCVVLPKTHAVDIVEKDECNAVIVFYPQSLNADQAKYLVSSLHKPPFRIATPLVKANFNPQVVPFKNFKDEWEKLAKSRDSSKELFDTDWNNPKAKAFTENYSKTYKDLSAKTLAAMKADKSEIEIVEFGYMGCH